MEIPQKFACLLITIKICISLQQFDWIIFEEVISLFDFEYFTKFVDTKTNVSLPHILSSFRKIPYTVIPI
jgi:hypothetical protein